MSFLLGGECGIICVPGNDGLDRIFLIGGLHNEPEEHVGHVDDPDGLCRAGLTQ
jgi:hypothetical protein